MELFLYIKATLVVWCSLFLFVLIAHFCLPNVTPEDEESTVPTVEKKSKEKPKCTCYADVHKETPAHPVRTEEDLASLGVCPEVEEVESVEGNGNIRGYSAKVSADDGNLYYGYGSTIQEACENALGLWERALMQKEKKE